MKKLIVILFALLFFSSVLAQQKSRINSYLLSEMMENCGEVRVIDVRSAEEFALSRIPMSENIPAFEFVGGEWKEIPDFLNKIDSLYQNSSEKLVFVCKSNGRSGKVVKSMIDKGYSDTRIFDLSGGLLGEKGWKESNMTLYESPKK